MKPTLSPEKTELIRSKSNCMHSSICDPRLRCCACIRILECKKKGGDGESLKPKCHSFTCGAIDRITNVILAFILAGEKK